MDKIIVVCGMAIKKNFIESITIGKNGDLFALLFNMTSTKYYATGLIQYDEAVKLLADALDLSKEEAKKVIEEAVPKSITGE